MLLRWFTKLTNARVDLFKFPMGIEFFSLILQNRRLLEVHKGGSQ